jgi:hypothetical protein
MKMMVSLGMLSKEEYIIHLKGRLEALKNKNVYLIKVFTWNFHPRVGALVPPIGNHPSPETSNVVSQ